MGHWKKILWLCLVIGSSVSASSIHVDGSSDQDYFQGLQSPGLVGVFAVGVIICLVLVLFGCADFCFKGTGFKDFENDAFASDDGVPLPPGASAEFNMYPPVENTPDTVSVMPVVFEPLPDITAKLHHPRHSGANTSRLRPKVTLDARERMDSEDSLDEILNRDTTQKKLRLQNLVTNSRHQLPRCQLQYIKELGNGWFGKVLQGEGLNILPGHKKTKVVIQMLKEDSDSTDQLSFLEEGSPYRDIDHANVLKLLGHCVDTSPFLAILELCPFGDLKTYLRSHRVAMDSFNEKGLLLKFACDIAAGLQAMHQEGLVHRDFATRNCLLASDLAVKIGDYGLSEETFKEDYYQDAYGDSIPIRWLAPESMVALADGVSLRRITRQSNIWSYAVALWEVVTFGSMPYGDLTNDQVLRLVVHEQCVKPSKPDVQLTHLDRMYDLMQLCWTESEQRPSLRELRIMLLHLLSRKEETDSSAFDLKWNQLMPRRPPKVARVGGATPYPGTGGAPAAGARVGSGDVPPAPGTEGGSGLRLTELDVSKLAEAGSFSSLSGGGGEALEQDPRTPGPLKELLVSPVNELSLEAEFSALGSRPAGDPESSLDNSPLSVEEDEQQTTVDGMRIEQAETEDQTPPNTKTGKDTARKGEIFPTPTKQVTCEDFEGFRSSNMPDIVATSTPTGTLSPGGGPPDFMTSTPKKGCDVTEGEAYVTAPSGGSSGATRQASGLYHTALTSQTSRSSTDRSVSFDIEDGALFGERKFANMLQTVALTSMDAEDPDASLGSSIGPLEEEVFRTPATGGSDARGRDGMGAAGAGGVEREGGGGGDTEQEGGGGGDTEREGGPEGGDEGVEREGGGGGVKQEGGDGGVELERGDGGVEREGGDGGEASGDGSVLEVTPRNTPSPSQDPESRLLDSQAPLLDGEPALGEPAGQDTTEGEPQSHEASPIHVSAQ